LRTKVGMRDAVVVEDGRYRLSPRVDVDLRRAEAVVRASAGGVLDAAKRSELHAIVDAYRSGAVDRFRRFAWARGLVARIDDLVCKAAAVLAAEALAADRYDDAVRYAGELSAVDPLNEIACETVVRALLARGDGDGARRELRRYTAALAAELGAVPAKHLVDLVRGV
jgi:DNA-binding SARP family transcriptional activator